MGGSFHSHTGGASNYLCLPLNPTFDNFTPGDQTYSTIFGTKYKVKENSNLFTNNLNNLDALCAVCHVQSRGSQVMIPARNDCPSGWTLEYKGYLMSTYKTDKGRTQFICVDEDAEGANGSQPDANSAFLYFVEGRCGSLPCPPYAYGKELACAVCTI